MRGTPWVKVNIRPLRGAALQMWFLTSHVLVLVIGVLFGGVLAWQWRSVRAWRHEVVYQREWSDKVHATEAYTSKQLGAERDIAAAALESKNAKILGMAAEIHALETQIPKGRRQALRNDARSTPMPVVAPTRQAAQRASRPRGDRAARNGRAPSLHRDDLKQIKGIGPVFEKQLHELGYRRLRDIARWGREDLAKVNRKLDMRGDRIGREDWIAQAKDLVKKNSSRV